MEERPGKREKQAGSGNKISRQRVPGSEHDKRKL
jgi:hypothetical protein